MTLNSPEKRKRAILFKYIPQKCSFFYTSHKINTKLKFLQELKQGRWDVRRRVEWLMVTDVSEVRSDFIFRMNQSKKRWLSAPGDKGMGHLTRRQLFTNRE